MSQTLTDLPLLKLKYWTHFILQSLQSVEVKAKLGVGAIRKKVVRMYLIETYF